MTASVVSACAFAERVLAGDASVVYVGEYETDWSQGPSPHWGVRLFPDMDADSMPELVVGSGEGDLYVVSMSHEGASVEVSDAAWSALTGGDTLGAMASWEADGAWGLAVGSSGSDPAGAVFLVPMESRSRPIDEVAQAVLYGDERTGFGADVAALGDQDADGIDEVLVASPWEHDALGLAYVFEGEFQGVGGPDDAMAQIVGELPSGWYEGMGMSVSAGDYDGDGIEDVAVGVPEYPDAYGHQGAGYVVLGPTEGTIWLRDAWMKVWYPEGECCTLGYHVDLTADVDNDGRKDFALSDPTNTSGADPLGAVWLVSNTSGEAHPDAVAWSSYRGDPGTHDRAGSSFALGDFDVDGRADLAIGAPGAPAAPDDYGAVYVVFAPSPGTWALSDAVSSLSPTNGAERGFAVAALDDEAGAWLLFAEMGEGAEKRFSVFAPE